MSNIVITGASTNKGGYYAAMLEQAGHKVLKVGKGGPDFNLDLRWASAGQIDSIFQKCRTKLGDWPRHVILNADMECSKSIVDCDPCNDWGQLLQCNLWAPTAIAMAFVRVKKFHAPKVRGSIIYIAKMSKEHTFNRTAIAGVTEFNQNLDRYCDHNGIAISCYELWVSSDDTRADTLSNIEAVIKEVESPTE